MDAVKRSESTEPSGKGKKRKETRTISVSERYVQNRTKLKDAYQQSKPITIDGCELISEPFKALVLTDFIDSQSFLRDLKTELDQEVDYVPKNNDLYRFRQSADFSTIDLPNIRTLRNCFLEQIRPLLADITGIELFDDVVDLTASKYEYNDTLLCHDDQLEERRIAFILYLVSTEWTGKDGGTFDMFDRNEQNQPQAPIRRLSPKWNQFVCFEVTPQSYHQVAEVLSEEKTRLTVNGWFRGPRSTKVHQDIYIEDYPSMIKCGDIEITEQLFRSWINPTYLDDDTQLQVMEEFKDRSELCLADFLLPDKYEQLCQLFNSDGHLDWIHVGPPNRRNFYRLNIDSAPRLAKEFVSVFESEMMFLIMSNMSGIKYHPLAPDTSDSESESEPDEEPESGDSTVNRADRPNSQSRPEKIRNPRLSLEIRKWTRGCYTLVHDHDPEVLDEQAKLDVMLHFEHDGETDRHGGGFMTYIAKDADEELLTVEPQSNQLSMVYRDTDTARFMKYLNESHPRTFYDISLVFHE